MSDDADLRRLEAAMWRPETRGDRAWMDAHLSQDFLEFGQSGRRYSRAEIIAVDVSDLTDARLLEDLSIRFLSDRLALVTYRSEIGGSRANRSSIWKRSESGWLLEFHQGTPAQPEDR